MWAPYTRFHAAATGVAFPQGPCDALYVKATITTSDLVATTIDDNTINLGLAPIGTTIVGQFKSVTFSGGPAGAVVACFYETRSDKTQLS